MGLALGDKKWGDKSKAFARHATIVLPYRSIFGIALPDEQQYWTLCGEMGGLNPDCELMQLVSCGLISPYQFHGVETSPEIHAANIYAANRSDIHLHCGEFTKVLDTALGEGTLNPGIVYLDTTCGPKIGAPLLARTMNILNRCNSPAMLVWNTVMVHRYYKMSYSWDDFNTHLRRNDLFCCASEQWSQFGDPFTYGGTGKSATTMASVVWIRI